MSITVYRLTSRTVKLTDGRTANVIVQCGQPGGRGDLPASVKRVMTFSEQFLATGKATGLIVSGRIVNNKAEVIPGSPVYTNCGSENTMPRAYWYDYHVGAPEFMKVVPGVTVPGAITYTAGMTISENPCRTWTHPDGTQMPKGFVPEVYEVPEFYKGEVAAMREHLTQKAK